MSTNFDISLSGMAAASARLFAAAKNIANTYSTGTSSGEGPSDTTSAVYQPVRVEQTATANGGTKAVEIPVEPPTTQAFLPDHPDADEAGVLEFPNVSFERELVETKAALNSYKANAAVIRAEDEMFGELLDVLS